jgi:hypothetical protein
MAVACDYALMKIPPKGNQRSTLPKVSWLEHCQGFPRRTQRTGVILRVQETQSGNENPTHSLLVSQDSKWTVLSKVHISKKPLDSAVDRDRSLQVECEISPESKASINNALLQNNA